MRNPVWDFLEVIALMEAACTAIISAEAESKTRWDKSRELISTVKERPRKRSAFDDSPERNG